jgi:hypothetical protein
LIGPGTPDFAVGNKAAEDVPAFHARARINDFHVSETDALLKRATGAGRRELEFRSLGGPPDREDNPGSAHDGRKECFCIHGFKSFG